MIRLKSLRLFVFSLILLPGLAMALQHSVPDKSAVPGLQTAVPSGRIVIKFSEGADVTVTPGGLESEGSDAADRLTGLIARAAPGAVLERRFSRPADQIESERLAAQALAGRELPDLNRYAQLSRIAPEGDRAVLMAVLRQILADPAVQTAFLEPVAVPAALGFDAFTGETPPASPAGGHTDRSDTPDFSDLQGYLEAPPLGIDVWDMAGTLGADGATVKVIDIEGAWLWTHEDLPDPFAEIGDQIDNLGWRNHGTAVLGEIRGGDNGYGVRGIAPACEVGCSSIGSQSTADALNNAAAALDAGDVILIELHAPGPNANGEGQYGYVCMEFWQDNFDAILLATASGRIVCEAAGNGQQDFDDPVYMGLFDRNVRDSGAIMCGASNGGNLSPAYFTNYGSRVDLHGWGYDVVTCGYGWLQGEPLEEEFWYTNGFSGTSSASPIVVGAVVSLQGMSRAAFGITLDARLARDILVDTGTPQENPEIHIGPRPDLGSAWALASGGIGELAGTITDLETALPLAGVRVEVDETGAFALSDENGEYRFSLLVGDYNLNFSSFFYEDASAFTSIASGETSILDMALVPMPTYEVGGQVYSETGDPLADVRVTPLDVPIAGTTTDAAGVFWFRGIPEEVPVEVLMDGLPYFGAAVGGPLVDTGLPDGSPPPNVFGLPFVDVDFENNDGGFWTDGDNIWDWGTPAAGGPEGSGFSGAKCWGVGMDDNYGDDQTGYLVSPSYNLTGWMDLYLSFHHWRETEAGFDGVNVQAYQGGEWYWVEPLTGYTDILLGGLDYEGGWAGESGGWEGVVFDLSEFISDDFRFRLKFGSDGGVTGEGFWVDDVALYEGLIATSVDGDGQAETVSTRLSIYPNPFNPKTSIAWSSMSAVEEIAIFDAGGRRVRTLMTGPVADRSGSLVWDGRDDANRTIASGVYFVRLKSAKESVASRLILMK